MTPITHKRKLKNLEATLSDLSLLQERYPSAFTPKGVGVVKPLKVNIVDDIKADIELSGLDLTLGQIKRVLGFWCSRKFYLKSIVRESVRVDLHGAPAGPVMQDEKVNAQGKIEAINLNRMLSEATLL